MKKIGFLGCGKIGNALLKEARKTGLAQTVFIQDPFFKGRETNGIPVINCGDPELCRQVDLVIECATADALKQNIENILLNCDLLLFSTTAFSDQEFATKVRALCGKSGRHVYLPHGAILGLDGIADGKSIWEKVSIETTKNPKSLGRNDRERTTLFHGSTREACQLFPRNVNVHASVALAGIGFDLTESIIISDPSICTNSHVINLLGDGASMQIQVSSIAESGVTGAYTPLSACGSLRRILSEREMFRIV